MQVGPGREARFTGVSDVLAAHDVLADAHADGIPMQMSVESNRPEQQERNNRNVASGPLSSWGRGTG